MARVITPHQAKRLGLPGRVSHEIISGAMGAHNASVRLVEIPVAKPGETARGPHVHHGFEECIYVLSGEGRMVTPSGVQAIGAGDTVLVPAEEPHVTRNTGGATLLLLCFFPTPDVARSTEDLVPPFPPAFD
jgi:mannose-6-phosphate isomerase-like protein (cupin superfamily)